MSKKDAERATMKSLTAAELGNLTTQGFGTTLLNSDGKPFIYITGDVTRNVLTVTLTNNTGRDWMLAGGSPVEQSASEGPSTFYIYLDHLLGTEDIARIKLATNDSIHWGLGHFYHGRRFGLALAPKNAMEFRTGAAGALRLRLDHITTDREPTSVRYASVFAELRVTDAPPSTERRIKLIIDRPPETARDLELVRAFVGKRTSVIIKAEGVPSNTLCLLLENPSSVPLVPSGGKQAQFILQFHTSEKSTPEALTTDDEAASFKVEPLSPAWQVEHKPRERPPYVVLHPQKDTILDSRERAQFKIVGIETQFEPGPAWVYLSHSSIPKVRNGQLITAVSKVEGTPTVVHFRAKHNVTEVEWGTEATLQWQAYGSPDGTVLSVEGEPDRQRGLVGEDSFTALLPETRCTLHCGKESMPTSIRTRQDPVEGIGRVFFPSAMRICSWDPRTRKEQVIYEPDRDKGLLSDVEYAGGFLFVSNRDRNFRIVRMTTEGRNARVMFQPRADNKLAEPTSLSAFHYQNRLQLGMMFRNIDPGFMMLRPEFRSAYIMQYIKEERGNICGYRGDADLVPPLARLVVSVSELCIYYTKENGISRSRIGSDRIVQAILNDVDTKGRLSPATLDAILADVRDDRLQHADTTQPADLALDDVRKRIFWRDAGKHALFSASLDLGDVQRHCDAYGNREFAGMVVEPTTGDVLWIDGQDNRKTLRRWSRKSNRVWVLDELSGPLNEGGLALLPESEMKR